jgi:acyl-CoA synthetase (AMP-forming)/AMP-acid ligase II
MVFKSPYPDVSIPDVSLTEYVLRRAEALGEKPALVDGASGRTITFGQLPGMVRTVAAGLARRGIGKGDVVALYSCNVPEYAVAFHAIASLGGIVTTVNPLSTAEELAPQLADSRTRIVICAPELVGRSREAAEGLDLIDVYVFGEAEGATPFAQLLEETAAPPEVAIDPATDLVALPYSSGTTGLPKGVMLTHRNLVANICQFSPLEHVSDSDTLICVLPMFHIYGMTVIMNGGLSHGATVVTLPRFDLELFLRVIAEHHVTFAHVVPPIVLTLAKHPLVDAYDLSSLRAVFSGAAPLRAELCRAVAERLGCMAMQGYGLTETSPVTHAASAERSRVRDGSVGTIVPNTECRLVDVESGEDVGPGREGEILIRGPQVMKGYFNNQEATAATIDPDGWLHTGDVGVVDEDGYFFVVDRVKELIKFKGFQVAPAELEALLLTHPAVADAAVVPSPDPEAGEVPVAFVVHRAEVSAEELMAHVAGHVAPYKRIRSIEFVDQIPKSASGKILRRLLVERVRARGHAGA